MKPLMSDSTMWRRNKKGSLFRRKDAFPHTATADLGTTVAGELTWTVKAQSAEIELDLGERVGGRIDSKGDGSEKGVDRVDRVDSGRLDVDGDGLDLSFLDNRLDLERGVVGTRRLGTERKVVGSFEREAEVVRLGSRRDGGPRRLRVTKGWKGRHHLGRRSRQRRRR